MNRHTMFQHYERSVPASLLFAALLALGTLLGSCSPGIVARSLFGEELDITVRVDSVANNEFPLAMTVLYVYDEDQFKKFLKYSARQWYDERQGLEEAQQDDPVFEAFDWEWIPGQDTSVAVPFRTSAVGALIFANYFTEGQHRVRIDPYTDISVECGYDDLKVAPLK